MSLGIRIRTYDSNLAPCTCSYCKRTFLSNESIAYHPEVSKSPAYHHGCYTLKLAGIAEIEELQTPASTAKRRAQIEQEYPAFSSEEIDYVMEMHSAPPKKMKKDPISNDTLAAFAALKDKRTQFDVLKMLIKELEVVWPALSKSCLTPLINDSSMIEYTAFQRNTIIERGTELNQHLHDRILDLAPYYVKDRFGVATVNGMVWDIRLVAALYRKLIEELEKDSGISNVTKYEDRLAAIDNAIQRARRLPPNMVHLIISYDQSVRYWSKEDHNCSGYPIEDWLDMYKLVTSRIGAKDCFIISLFATVLIKHGNSGCNLTIDQSNWREDDDVDEDGKKPRKRVRSETVVAVTDDETEDENCEAKKKEKEKKGKKTSPKKNNDGKKKDDKEPPPPPSGSGPGNSAGGGNAGSGSSGSTNSGVDSVNWKLGPNISPALASAFGRSGRTRKAENMESEEKLFNESMAAIRRASKLRRVDILGDMECDLEIKYDPVDSPFISSQSWPLSDLGQQSSSAANPSSIVNVLAEPEHPQIASQSTMPTSPNLLPSALASSSQRVMNICSTPPSSAHDDAILQKESQWTTISSPPPCSSPTLSSLEKCVKTSSKLGMARCDIESKSKSGNLL